MDVAQHICSTEGWGPPADNGDAIRLLGEHGPQALQAPQSPTAPRTSAVNASSPIPASLPGCPPHRLVTTCRAASQVLDSSGWAHISITAGHATDKKSWIRCDDAVTAVTSCGVSPWPAGGPA